VQPDHPDAYFNLGTLLVARGDDAAAVETYAAGHDLCRGCAPLTDRLLHTMQKICDWSRFEELSGRRRREIFEAPDQTTSPFTLLSIPATAAEHLACARRVGDRLQAAAAVQDVRLPFEHPAKAKPRLKIGYLSADFREHVVGYVVAEVLELHNRDRL